MISSATAFFFVKLNLVAAPSLDQNKAWNPRTKRGLMKK
jgi:hypothetical protein